MKRGGISLRRVGLKGQGVFAGRVYQKNELVIIGKPVYISSVRTDYSFQMDINFHVQLDKPARLINHSCDPNLGIKNNTYGGYDFFALKRIKVGEELTWDYCTSEYYSISIKGNCLCESVNCRGKITGYNGLPKETRRKYNTFIARYLQEIL